MVVVGMAGDGPEGASLKGKSEVRRWMARRVARKPVVNRDGLSGLLRFKLTDCGKE